MESTAPESSPLRSSGSRIHQRISQRSTPVLSGRPTTAQARPRRPRSPATLWHLCSAPATGKAKPREEHSPEKRCGNVSGTGSSRAHRRARGPGPAARSHHPTFLNSINQTQSRSSTPHIVLNQFQLPECKTQAKNIQGARPRNRHHTLNTEMLHAEILDQASVLDARAPPGEQEGSCALISGKELPKLQD